MATLGTLSKFRPTRDRKEMLAANTAEGGFSPSMLKQSVIPPIIKQPQAEKDHGDQQTENYGGGNEIHREIQCFNLEYGAN
ncbi:MAG: hypothetical protein IPP19_12600 [Verrucomicrobia bacterium]|nr:hypothetical protein [Verrucomicrobiota bacterium]